MNRLSVLALAVLSVGVSMGQEQPVPAPSNTQAQTVQKKLSLQTSKTSYCVGEATQYVVTATPDIQGVITWTSTFQPWGTQETKPFQETNYGHTLQLRDSFSYWSGKGDPWSITQAGKWSKTATINGFSDTANFEVNYCTGNISTAERFYLSPSPGQPIFVRIGNPETTVIRVVFEKLADTAFIRSIRVVLNNQDITNVALDPKNFRYGSMFGLNDRNDQYFAPAVTVALVIPQFYFYQGGNQFEVEVQMRDGRRYREGGEYQVRPVDEDSQSAALPSLIEEEPLKLSCPNPPFLLINYSQGFSAEGGNGTFFWSAPGAVQQTNQGRHFAPYYKEPGGKTVSLRSGSQQVSCQLTVAPALPMPPPQTVGRQ